MSATYTIRPLKVGEFLTHEKSTLTLLYGFGEKLRTPITMWLIQGNGKNIIVDTGLGDDEWCIKYHHPTFQDETTAPLNALKNVGLTPDDIDFVINTHLHWDHCFNNYLFKGKKMYVQKKELEFAMNPLPCQSLYYESELIGMTPAFKKVMDDFVPVDGDVSLCDGIDLVFLPSHTPGSQGVLVNTVGGKYLIAGDAIGSYENWYGSDGYIDGKLPHTHILPAIHVDLEACQASYAKIEKLADYVLPGHDMKVYDHAVYPLEAEK